MGRNVTAALGNLVKAGKHGLNAAREGFGQVGTRLASADTKAAAAIAARDGNFWHAALDGISLRPATSFVVGTSVVGAAAVAGHHMLSADRSQGPGRGGR